MGNPESPKPQETPRTQKETVSQNPAQKQQVNAAGQRSQKQERVAAEKADREKENPGDILKKIESVQLSPEERTNMLRSSLALQKFLFDTQNNDENARMFSDATITSVLTILSALTPEQRGQLKAEQGTGSKFHHDETDDKRYITLRIGQVKVSVGKEPASVSPQTKRIAEQDVDGPDQRRARAEIAATYVAAENEALIQAAKNLIDAVKR